QPPRARRAARRRALHVRHLRRPVPPRRGRPIRDRRGALPRGRSRASERRGLLLLDGRAARAPADRAASPLAVPDDFSGVAARRRAAGVLAAGGAASGGRRRVLMPGRSASPTPLRCSGAGLAAETPFAHLRFASVEQPRRKSEWIACVPAARTPAPRPALLAAPQIARAAGHP